MREIWLRFRNGQDLPVFFKRLRLVSAILVPILIGIAEAVPSLNVVLFVMNKGTEYQDVIRILPVLTAINIGIVAASQLTLNPVGRQKLEQELNQQERNASHN